MKEDVGSERRLETTEIKECGRKVSGRQGRKKSSVARNKKNKTRSYFI